MMKNYYCFLLLNLPFLLCGQVLLNADFEQWPDTLYQPIYELSDFGALNPSRGIPLDWRGKYPFGGVCQVENSHSGDYAVLLYTYYNYNPGILQQAIITEERPDQLSGYYQYYLIDADYQKAIRQVDIRAWYQGETIGGGLYDFDTSSVYQPFEVPIKYTAEETPDSITMVFTTNGLLSAGSVSGFLYLDDLQLSKTPVSANEAKSGYVPTIECYPNPTKDKLYLNRDYSNYQYQILDISGSIVKAGTISGVDNWLSLGELNRGIFLLQLKGGQGAACVKKIYIE